MNERLEEYIKTLSSMINLKTVSYRDSFDKDAFDAFHNLLRELFPNVFKKFIYEEFNGSILLSLIVNEDDPVLLMSHHDVVSENGEWKHEPFNAVVEDGKIYGRGTLDTKGNLWAIFQSIEELIEEGYEFKRSIYIESACNEETTGDGALEISRELKRRGVHFKFTLDEGGMIVYDPIGGAKGYYAMVALGEKNCIDLKFVAHSKGGHSSTPDKTNPLSRLSRFIVDVERSKIFKPKLDEITIETFKKLSYNMKGLLKFVFKHAKHMRWLLAKLMVNMSPTAASLVKTTICFTKALGSDEYNVIPTTAYVTGNIRASHRDSLDSIIKKLQKIAKKNEIEIEVIDPGYYSGICDYKTKEFELLENTISNNFEGVITAPYISTGASDSKYFSDLSENVFRFAPFTVSDEQLDSMHAKDENIDIETLPKAVDFYKDLIRKL